MPEPPKNIKKNNKHTIKKHPNFSKVFVIGLGCECAQISLYQDKPNFTVKIPMKFELRYSKFIKKINDLVQSQKNIAGRFFKKK